MSVLPLEPCFNLGSAQRVNWPLLPAPPLPPPGSLPPLLPPLHAPTAEPWLFADWPVRLMSPPSLLPLQLLRMHRRLG